VIPRPALVSRGCLVGLLACLTLLVVQVDGRDRQAVVADSLRTFIVSSPGLRPANLTAHLEAYPPARRPEALEGYLDSLGYFDVARDTLPGDTIVVRGGRRAIIDSVVVSATGIALTIDSVDHPRWPRPYDAEAVASIARAGVRFAARRGYPFAVATVTVDTREEPRPGDPAHLTIRIDVAPGRPAVFGAPAFRGDPTTRRRLLGYDIAFDEGERFDLSLVEESRKRLLARDYISDVHPASPALPASAALTTPSPADSIDTVMVPFHLEDRSGLGMEGALGYASDLPTENRLSGTLDLTLLNLFRWGEAASLHYRGERTYNEMEIDLSKPHLFGMPLVGSVGFGLELEQKSYGYLHGEAELLYEPAALWQTGVAVSAHETTVEAFDSLSSWRYYGFDLITKRLGEPRRAGSFSRWLSLRAGTGITTRHNDRHNRFRVDVRGGLHLPFARRHALSVGLVGQTAVTQSGDRLHEVELFRTGGHHSLRGYAEDEFAFRTVGYGQLEYLFYFTRTGSVYIFTDGGIGFPDKIRMSPDHHTEMLGYGLGIRAPIRIGTISLEWARSIADRSGFGRVHVRIRNALSRRKNPWHN
jgi:hypothetical protein